MALRMQAKTDASELLSHPLSAKDKEQILRAIQSLPALIDSTCRVSIALSQGKKLSETVEVPAVALTLLRDVLEALSEDRSIVAMSSSKEMTTVEAADFLNVSRPFVIKEIEAGRLPHRKVGSHRRIAFSDLVGYARNMRSNQESALDRMAINAQELGLTY